MTLENRDGRTYYYESQRVGRRVVKRYWGSGACAVVMAQYDTLMRQERRADRDFKKRRLLRQKRRTAKLRQWLADAARVTADALVAAGWHQHKHEWRHKRGATVGALQTTTQPAPLPWYEPALRSAAGHLDQTIDAKAAKGDPSALRAVEDYLRNPVPAYPPACPIRLRYTVHCTVCSRVTRHFVSAARLPRAIVYFSPGVVGRSSSSLRGFLPHPINATRKIDTMTLRMGCSVSGSGYCMARLEQLRRLPAAFVADADVRTALVLDNFRASR